MSSSDPGKLNGLDLEEGLNERDRAELVALSRLLAQDHVPPRPGFAQQVVKSLPAAGWEAKSPAGWRFVAMLLLLLGGASAALVGTGSARLAPSSAFGGAVEAVADLFQAAALAGAGMLAASWKGMGLAMGELTRGSWVSLAAFGMGVLGLNVVFFLQLKKHRRALATSGASAGANRRAGMR